MKDDGPGIPETDLERIFRKYQTGKDESGKRDSFGLGLTFCRMAADSHGGTIHVESEVGRGTEFRITIPAYETSSRSQ